MTEKANPSVNRTAEAFKTAGAIAYGGHGDGGWITPAASPTEIAIQDPGITEGNLNAFAESSSASSFDVTIDAGEAFVFGSWIAIDTSTNVTLASSTNDQTVYVGWNKDGSDDVIVGLDSAFANSSGDTDKKIPLFDFDTDGSGVTSVTDRRTIDQTIDARVLSFTNTISSNYTTDGEQVFFVDSSGGSITLTLSTRDLVDGNVVSVVDVGGSAGTNAININTEGSANIDGLSSFSLDTDYGATELASDGTNWYTAEVQGKTEEQIEDIVNGLISDSGNITVTYDDPNNTLTIDTSALNAEQVEDQVDQLLQGGTGITLTYDDPNDTLTIDGHTKYTDEEAQDAVGTITSGGDKITVTYDDAGNSLTIDTSALDAEEVEDQVNSLITSGTGISSSYDDANDTLTISTVDADIESQANDDPERIMGAETGPVNSGDAGVVVINGVVNGDTIELYQASLIDEDGSAVASGVDLIIATLDNAGSGTSRVTVLSGDGSTVLDDQSGTPLASWSNSTGSDQTVAILVDNGQFNTGSGSNQNVSASVLGRVV